MKTISKLILVACLIFSMFAVKAQQIPEIEMVKVKGGEFVMGCTKDQRQDCNRDEIPPHLVVLEDYYVSKYEVTQELWKAVMGGKNPSHIRGDKLPVTCVSWEEAMDFIHRLNQVTGKKYRLLSEAEWEYAACGGEYSHKYRFSGSNDIDEVAWHRGNSDRVLHDVGTKKPNELGIYDMSGNVHEWCSDGYDYYELSFSGSYGNQHDETFDNCKVYRGGSMDSFWDVCRVTARGNALSVAKQPIVGFRLAMDGE